MVPGKWLDGTMFGTMGICVCGSLQFRTQDVEGVEFIVTYLPSVPLAVGCLAYLQVIAAEISVNSRFPALGVGVKVKQYSKIFLNVWVRSFTTH